MASNSRLKDLYKHLKDKGFQVYWPGQHKGEVEKPYIVIKTDATERLGDYSSYLQIYNLLCYVPDDMFGDMEEFILSIKLSMKELYPTFVYQNNDSPSFYDSDVKGHMISIYYRNAKHFSNLQ